MSSLSPFRPGFGGQPPYLAGREPEQQLLQRYLDAVAAGVAPGTAVVLYGPRGNGKTVLLGWLQREAARISGVGAATLQPAAAADEMRLRELLVPKPWWERLAVGGIGIAGLAGKLGQGRRPPVEEILAARATREPLLLLVDEAHTLDLAVGRVLLNASQAVGSEHPFLLVLAGTPNLEDRLSSMGVSFWSRAEQFRIGRLSQEAAGEAFRRPLEREGFEVAEEATALLVRESQRYPYFVQLLGEKVWRRVAASSVKRPEVTRAAVDAALPDFYRTRNHFYRQRAVELRKQNLLPAARAVAQAFRGRPVIAHEEVQAAVRAADPDREDAAFRTLQHLGLIWEADFLQWEPGIPSLMDYLRDRVPPG